MGSLMLNKAMYQEGDLLGGRMRRFCLGDLLLVWLTGLSLKFSSTPSAERGVLHLRGARTSRVTNTASCGKSEKLPPAGARLLPRARRFARCSPALPWPSRAARPPYPGLGGLHLARTWPPGLGGGREPRLRDAVAPVTRPAKWTASPRPQEGAELRLAKGRGRAR